MPCPLPIAEKLRRFSPHTIRLLARTGAGRKVRALLRVEIIHNSGLDGARVDYLSTLTSWDTVTVAEMHAFLKGCRAEIHSRVWLDTSWKIIKRYGSRQRILPLYLVCSPEWASILQPLSVQSK